MGGLQSVLDCFVSAQDTLLRVYKPNVTNSGLTLGPSVTAD